MSSNSPTAPPPGARWLSVAELAAARGCSIRTVKRWIEQGEVETRKDGARRLVRAPEEGHGEGTQGTWFVSLSNDREAELKAEIAFLRGIVESDRRDMAELRAALRKALDIVPRQLTASSGAAPDASASDAPESPLNGAVGSCGQGAVNGPQRGAQRAETALSYGDIADELEREMNR